MQENIRAVIDDLAFQRWAQLRRWITTHVATAIIEASHHDCAGVLMHQTFRVIEKYGAAAFTTNHKCGAGRLFIGQLVPPEQEELCCWGVSART